MIKFLTDLKRNTFLMIIIISQEFNSKKTETLEYFSVLPDSNRLLFDTYLQVQIHLKETPLVQTS